VSSDSAGADLATLLRPPSAAAAIPLSRRQILLLFISGSFVGLLAWWFYLMVFRGDPGQDWMVFYTAARAYLDGNLPLVFDGRALTAAINQRFAGWLGFALNLHPWVYPPTFLLLFLPFGLLPPVLSLALFLLSGCALAGAATWRSLECGAGRALVGFSLLLCPAVPFNVMTGQNAFFTSALLLGGFGLLRRLPVMAGVLFGIMTFKPQFWLMVPVALLAARQWRALASTAATALALALLTLPVFGIEIWRHWFELMSGADPTYREWVVNGRLNGLSVFACATWLGAPAVVANLAQALAVAAAAGFVYWAYRAPRPAGLQLAIMFAATMLAALHASASDAVLLGLAASLYLAAPRRGVLPSSAVALAAAVWIAPLLNPPSIFRPGAFTPVLILLFLANIVGELRRSGRTVRAAA
jgi:Glycosyltransferase family 87